MIRTKDGIEVEIYAISTENEWVWVRASTPEDGWKLMGYKASSLVAGNGWAEIADAIGKKKTVIVDMPDYCKVQD